MKKSKKILITMLSIALVSIPIAIVTVSCVPRNSLERLDDLESSLNKRIRASTKIPEPEKEKIIKQYKPSFKTIRNGILHAKDRSHCERVIELMDQLEEAINVLFQRI
ncbi:Vmc-like lipoprotein signal peptide domain-containing protein [Ureaplasma canigenitalium]|uniref:Vmc-like lipoprotein signal peptide domain-containing protein n=1 Tax=Ureaplasma canigenitalium TaxID=42092 RepID=UPI0004E206DE|nr:hypothetical protein [Ureaplasma canigenitalium]